MRMRKRIAALLLGMGLFCCGYAQGEDVFTKRDLQQDYESAGAVTIQLQDAAVEDGVITIDEEGVYILSGALENGQVVVDAGKKDKVQLVLDGATIHSQDAAPIHIVQADKVFITTAEGSSNTLSNGGSFQPAEGSSVDAVVFSKEDLTLNGKGTLMIASPGGNGIVSKDSLRITGGSYEITCAGHAIEGKDEVSVAGGSLTLVAGKDGIHAQHDEDDQAGYVFIQGGDFSITAEGDGISVTGNVTIAGGSYDITCGGGSANGGKEHSEGWGFMGGGPGRGGFGGSRDPWGQTRQDSSADSTSMKGIKADGNVTITGGEIAINAADDALHANASMTIEGGRFDIASGDDAFHAEDTLAVSGGTILITESYEGLEAMHIDVSGGSITLTAKDDGFNAAGGNDESGSTGGRDGRFGGFGMMSANSDGTITVSGGDISITAYGDGIDANGTFDMTGGRMLVCGPTQGDTATLDYDIRAGIDGGTFIGTGSTFMAQTFSEAGQGVVAVQVSSQRAGAEICLTDKAGKEILRHAPALDFAVVILSTPEMVAGETYHLTVGTASGDIAAR